MAVIDKGGRTPIWAIFNQPPPAKKVQSSVNRPPQKPGPSSNPGKSQPARRIPPRPTYKRSRSQEANRDRQTNSAIYKQLLKLCPPPPQIDWYALPHATADVRTGAADPAQVLQVLRAKYSVKQLRTAGVLVTPKGQDTGEQLHPDLSSPQKLWIAITSILEEVIDLVGENGRLRSAAPTLFLAAAHDKSFRKALSEEPTCFVTFSVADMAILRSLNLPACTATGLHQLTRGDLEHFRKLTGDERDDAEEVPTDSHPAIESLILVGWSVARLAMEEPPGLQAVADHWRCLCQHFEMQCADAQIWRPTADDIRALRFIVPHAGQSKDITETIRQQASASSVPLVEIPPQAEVSLSTAYEILLRTAAKDYCRPQLPEQFQSLSDLVTRKFTSPLIAAAESNFNRLQANTQLIVAQLSHELHIRLAARQARHICKPSSRDSIEGRAELQDILRLAREIVHLSRQASSPRPIPYQTGSRESRLPWDT